MIEAYCAQCFRIETARYVLPARCPQCGAQTTWRALKPERPLRPWVLTDDDCTFLRIQGIAPI